MFLLACGEAAGFISSLYLLLRCKITTKHVDPGENILWKYLYSSKGLWNRRVRVNLNSFLDDILICTHPLSLIDLNK